MSRLALLCSTWLLAGCAWSVAPVLPFVEPPPNLPDDVVLMRVPTALVESLESPAVVAQLAEQLAEFTARAPEHAQFVLDHEIATGMTTQEVVWAFRSHPTAVVDRGPPGGHFLLWGRHRAWVPARYWVRLDEWGLVRAAGRY